MAEKVLNDVDKAILVINVQNIENLPVISEPIKSAAARTRTRLLITIFSTFFDSASGTGSWDAVQKLLTHAYVQATSVSQKHNKILMNVDVLLRGVQHAMKDVPDDWNMIFYSGNQERVPIPQAWLSLPTVHSPNNSDQSAILSTPSERVAKFSTIFPVVALGGTFDHLHAGHKILLSMAAWITGEKLIVGVTDDTLLSKKVHKELLEPLSTRLDTVRSFVSLFKPGLVYDIVPITDVYGPTGWDPDIQALVVSKETLPGAASIASLRTQKSFPPLQTLVIDVISAVSANLGTDDPEALKNTKMSSTFIRQWIHEQKEKASNSNVGSV